MKIRQLLIIWLSAPLFVSVDVSAAEYATVKPLLMQAIDAPGGAAKGILTGPIAEKMHQTTQSRDPVRVEVTTLKTYKQEGCKRLNVRLVQPNALTKDGGRADFTVDYGINLCRDGTAPMEAIDLSQFRQAIGRGQ